MSDATQANICSFACSSQYKKGGVNAENQN